MNKVLLLKLYKKFVSTDPYIIKIGMRAGFISSILCVINVLTHDKHGLAILATVGVFVISLIQVVAKDYPVHSRTYASIILSITAGIAAIFGGIIGHSVIYSIIAILLIVPLVGLSSLANRVSATIILLTVNLFVISTGFNTTIWWTIIYGMCFMLGGFALTLVSFMMDKTHQLISLDRELYRITFRDVFVNYQDTILFTCMLTLAVLIAYSMSIAYSIPQGYWIPMTTLLILKNDKRVTLQRLYHRLLGTLLGSIMAVILFWLVPNQLVLSIMMYPLLYFIVVCFLQHYGSYNFMLTIMISILLNLLDPRGYLIPMYRVLDTFLGVISIVLAILIVYIFVKLITKYIEPQVVK